MAVLDLRAVTEQQLILEVRHFAPMDGSSGYMADNPAQLLMNRDNADSP